MHTTQYRTKLKLRKKSKIYINLHLFFLNFVLRIVGRFPTPPIRRQLATIRSPLRSYVPYSALSRNTVRRNVLLRSFRREARKLGSQEARNLYVVCVRRIGQQVANSQEAVLSCPIHAQQLATPPLHVVCKLYYVQQLATRGIACELSSTTQ